MFVFCVLMLLTYYYTIYCDLRLIYFYKWIIDCVYHDKSVNICMLDFLSFNVYSPCLTTLMADTKHVYMGE